MRDRKREERDRERQRERECVCVYVGERESVGEQHNAGAQCAWRVIT